MTKLPILFATDTISNTRNHWWSNLVAWHSHFLVALVSRPTPNVASFSLYFCRKRLVKGESNSHVQDEQIEVYHNKKYIVGMNFSQHPASCYWRKKTRVPLCLSGAHCYKTKHCKHHLFFIHFVKLGFSFLNSSLGLDVRKKISSLSLDFFSRVLLFPCCFPNILWCPIISHYLLLVDFLLQFVASPRYHLHRHDDDKADGANGPFQLLFVQSPTEAPCPKTMITKVGII